MADSNPVISWSGIDCYGRWKALHYAARRFYAPVLLSCDDTDPGFCALTVTNDTREVFRGQIVCRLRDRHARVLLEERADLSAPAFGSVCGLRLDLRNETRTPEKQKSLYLEYELLEQGVSVSRGTTLFVRPKDFDFLPGEVSVKVRKEEKQFRLTLVSDVFVKGVCLSLRNGDAVFSDNWFDLHGAEPVTVTLPREGELTDLGPEELENRLQIEHYGPSVHRS